MRAPMSSPTPTSEPGSAGDGTGTGSSTASERPLERRATVGETPSPSCHRWRPRSKSVSNACERCRRRKIRCDGEFGPCSTCIRFCVACVRPPKLRDRVGAGAHRVLASRIQYLEAQLAEMGDVQAAASPHWREGLWNSMPSTPRPAQPALHVDTSFEMPQRPFSFDFAPSTPAESATQPDIPTIEISDCGGPSPAMLSPAPSLLSANSRCSTPEPYSITTPIMGSALAPPVFGSPVSPPVSACQPLPPPPPPPWDHLSRGEAHDGASHLSPPDHGDPSFSRRSSISSLGLDHDFGSISLQFSPFDDEPQPHPPATFPDPFRPTPPPKTPTRFEAETLSDTFFDRTPRSRRPVDRAFHQTCLDLVYDRTADGDDAGLAALLIAPYTPRMARFYVFMTMAVGMRLRTRGRRDGELLDSCYRLAMRLAEAPSFWGEAGGVEAAALLALFAESGEAPRAVGGVER